VAAGGLLPVMVSALAALDGLRVIGGGSPVGLPDPPDGLPAMISAPLALSAVAAGDDLRQDDLLSGGDGLRPSGFPWTLGGDILARAFRVSDLAGYEFEKIIKPEGHNPRLPIHPVNHHGKSFPR